MAKFIIQKIADTFDVIPFDSPLPAQGLVDLKKISEDLRQEMMLPVELWKGIHCGSAGEARTYWRNHEMKQGTKGDVT